MSQPTPKADQLRALREAKHQRGKDEKSTSDRAIRKSGNDAGSGVPAVVQPNRTSAKTKVFPAAKTKTKAKAKAGKKFSVRNKRPANP